jgi:hypothetical protein
MTSETARRRSVRRALALALALLGAGCASYLEVPIDMPVQSKIDTSRFRRVLIAGFASDIGGADVEVGSETVRLLQNQLRANSRLQVVEADRPPLEEALADARTRLAESGKVTKEERDQFRLETDRVLQDQEYWRKIGEEYQNPLIVTGRIGFEEQNRSGFQADERVVRDPATSRPRLTRGNRYEERRGYVLSADFHFVDGRTGETLHKEKFTEEVLYNEEQKVSALSSYFELMDRLLPNFLGVISPQRIRGTRVLLR